MGFGRWSRWADFLQTFFIQRACATSFHLFKIVTAFNISHKQQTFQRTNICSCGNHIHRYGNAWVVTVAKICQYSFGFFAFFDNFAVFVQSVIFGFIGNFFAKFVALPKFFAHHFDDVVSMAVIFGKNQGFWHFFAVREYYR